MRFVTPTQTLSEYKHRQMPVYETLATIGAGAAGIGAAAMPALGAIGSTALQALPGIASAAPSILSAFGIGGHKSSTPSFNPQQALALEQMQYGQMSPQALQFGQNAYNQAAQEGLQFSKQGTQANIANQNLVTPGSSAQRQLAQNQINSYIQGQIPQDVQQQINRQVAQNLGGGFNLFSGGGQAPQNFARNLGQTSLGLSQYGLSAAPTWQQLANQMVVSPAVGLSAGLQATGMGTQLAAYAAGLGNQLAESQYQGAFNQYGAQQSQNQGQTQMFQGLGSAANSIGGALNKSGFFNTLAMTGGIPAYTNQFGYDNMSSAGFYQSPQDVTAAGLSNPAFQATGPNTGWYGTGGK